MEWECACCSLAVQGWTAIGMGRIKGKEAGMIEEGGGLGGRVVNGCAVEEGYVLGDKVVVLEKTERGREWVWVEI